MGEAVEVGWLCGEKKPPPTSLALRLLAVGAVVGAVGVAVVAAILVVVAASGEPPVNAMPALAATPAVAVRGEVVGAPGIVEVTGAMGVADCLVER